MSKELVKKVDQDWFIHVSHTNLHAAINRIDDIFKKWECGCYDDTHINKHFKDDMDSMKNCLVSIKEALPEGAEDDTFLIHNNS
eukprot:SAG11_NODE_1458_length_4874_cov_218.142827_5_plen_84_part_00